MSRPREAELWERQRGESKQAFGAFEAYRDGDEDRGYQRVADALGKSLTLISRWGSRWRWVERAAAWDAERDRVRREEFLAGDVEVARAQAEDAAALRGALMEPARAFVAWLAERRAEGEDPFDGVSASERVRLLATSSRAFAQVVGAERLAHGLSTENVAGHDGGPARREVEGKTTEQLEAYLAGRADEAEEGARR